MIIKLKGANFSTNNINELLTSYFISITGGSCVTAASNISSVSKEGATYSNTFTVNTDYSVSNVEVTMGGTDITSTAAESVSGDGGAGSVIAISVPTVTGNISIKFTYAYIGAEEPDSPGSGEDVETVTFTLNATPSNATITLGATGYSTVTGTGSASITVASGTEVIYAVSADGYTPQEGGVVVTGTTSENIVLVASETPVNLWKYSSSDMDAIMENARYRLATGLPYKEEGDDFDKTYGTTEKIYVNGNTGTYTLDLQSGKTYRWQFIPYHEYGFLKLHNPWGGGAQSSMDGKRVFFYNADDSLVENDTECLDETGMLVTVPQGAVYMRFMAWGYFSTTSQVKPRYDTLMITEGETEYSEYIPYQN